MDSLLLLCGVPGVGKTRFCHMFQSLYVPGTLRFINQDTSLGIGKKEPIEFLTMHVEYDYVYRQLLTLKKGTEFNLDILKQCRDFVFTLISTFMSKSTNLFENIVVTGGRSCCDKEKLYEVELIFKGIRIPCTTNITQSSKIFSDKVNHFFLLDDNHVYTSIRKKYFKVCKYHEINFIILYFEPDYLTCLERISLREQTIPLPVFQKTYERFEYPKKGDLMARFTLSVNGEHQLEEGSMSWHEFFCLLLSGHFRVSSSNKKDINVLEMKRCSVDSEKHRFDIMLRRAVANIIHRESIEKKKHISRRLCEAKHCLLTEFEKRWKGLNDNNIDYWESVLMEQISQMQ